MQRLIAAAEHLAQTSVSATVIDNRNAMNSLLLVLDQVNLAQFEVSESDLTDTISRLETVGPLYHAICHKPSFHIGLFILPPGTSLPHHDHPSMTVVSRILSGAGEFTRCAASIESFVHQSMYIPSFVILSVFSLINHDRLTIFWDIRVGRGSFGDRGRACWIETLHFCGC